MADTSVVFCCADDDQIRLLEYEEQVQKLKAKVTIVLSELQI